MTLSWSLAQAAAQVGGRFQGVDTSFTGVGIDSRREIEGRLFVALRGERFDGHDFAREAIARGAVALLVERPLDLAVPQWIVTDTGEALGRLAAAHRDRFRGQVVAITGSNGKTTCKELLAAVLAGAGRVRSTQGNLNNAIGLPLTLLEAGDEDFLILEMGANHPGEIAFLTAIGRPHLALIANAGRAHLEGFGSLEGVARAKGEIVGGLPETGRLVIPSASPWTALWRTLADGRPVSTFGTDPQAQVRADPATLRHRWETSGFRTEFQVTAPGRSFPLSLGLAGRHNVHNALAITALALALDLDEAVLAAGLAVMPPVPGRLSPRTAPNGLRLIDDSYNANPDSVKAALAVLAGLPGRRVLVLGDLGELGSEAWGLHQQLGLEARAAGVAALFAVGPLSAAAVASFGRGGAHFAEAEALLAALRRDLDAAEDVVLIKGSRRAAMDRIADALCRPPGAP